MPTLSVARAVGAVLLAVSATLLSPLHNPRSAFADSIDSPGNAIASQALLDLDTYQGECYTWMQRVVSAAIGVDVGNDYRQGYLDAGFVEVSIDDAQLGDIIQIVDDSDTDGSSEFPGLHTVIVLQNLGGGLVNGVDSNQNWDGMVLIRENYDAAAQAARYPGGSYHVYRFSGTVSYATYTIVPGDTLNQIASSFGVSADTIAAANGIADIDLIQVGAVLRIPAGITTATASDTPASAANGTSYVVEPGDTLSAIAARFGVGISELQAANSISDPDLIFVGSTLVVP